MKWTGDPNWNYIFDGRFYTKEDLKWRGASESPGEILKTPGLGCFYKKIK